MQRVKLSLTIGALCIAQKRLDYADAYTGEQVTRLAESVVSVKSNVAEAALSFAIDNQGLAVITATRT